MFVAHFHQDFYHYSFLSSGIDFRDLWCLYFCVFLSSNYASMRNWCFIHQSKNKLMFIIIIISTSGKFQTETALAIARSRNHYSFCTRGKPEALISSIVILWWTLLLKYSCYSWFNRKKNVNLIYNNLIWPANLHFFKKCPFF